VAPVGARAVEALAAWLAAVLQAAAVAPPLPPCARLRTLENYTSPDPEAVVAAVCQRREVTFSFVRILARLTSFVSIPSSVLLRYVDLGGSAHAARLLMSQSWVPTAGLDSSMLQQVCAIQDVDAALVEDLAARTTPDDFGFRALWSRAAAPGQLGDSIRRALSLWVEVLDGDDVAASVIDTPLEIPELSSEEVEAEQAHDLEALCLALTSPWLQGLPLHSDTAKQVYSKRPLTVASVRVLRLALCGLESSSAETVLAEADWPCLAWHDSCGVVSLLEWLGYGSAALTGQISTNTALGRAAAKKADASNVRPLLARLLHGFLQTEQPSTQEAESSVVHRRHPRYHSRATVEAVECLLSACPRLARSSVNLEQLGPASLAPAFAGEMAATRGQANAMSECSSGPDLPSHAAGAGRLLPLQTLCVCCGETPNIYTAALAKALLRRSPDASSQPLPRALRRNARGRHYDLFVCTAASALQLRCLAAAEANGGETVAKNVEGDDTLESLAALFKLRDVLVPSAQPNSQTARHRGASGSLSAREPRPPAAPLPGGVAPQPPTSLMDARRRGDGCFVPSAPSATPPIRRSPRQLNSSLVLPQAPLPARAPRGSPLGVLPHATPSVAGSQRRASIRRPIGTLVLPAIQAQ